MRTLFFLLILLVIYLLSAYHNIAFINFHLMTIEKGHPSRPCINELTRNLLD